MMLNASKIWLHARRTHNGHAKGGYPWRVRNGHGELIAGGSGRPGRTDWGLIRSRLKTACGWTSKQIDNEPWFEVIDLLQYWQEKPPTHEILAAVYRIEKPKPKQYMDFDAMQNLMRTTGGKIAGL